MFIYQWPIPNLFSTLRVVVLGGYLYPKRDIFVVKLVNVTDIQLEFGCLKLFNQVDLSTETTIDWSFWRFERGLVLYIPCAWICWRVWTTVFESENRICCQKDVSVWRFPNIYFVRWHVFSFWLLVFKLSMLIRSVTSLRWAVLVLDGSLVLVRIGFGLQCDLNKNTSSDCFKLTWSVAFSCNQSCQSPR